MWSINGNKGEMCGAEVSRTVHVHVQRSRQIYAGKYQTVTHNPHNNRKFEASSCVPYVVRYHYCLQYPFSCGYFECLTYWKLGFITTAHAERKGVRSPPAMILIKQSTAYGRHIYLDESGVHSPDAPKSHDHWNQIWLKTITMFNIRMDEIYYMMNESQAKMTTP